MVVDPMQVISSDPEIAINVLHRGLVMAEAAEDEAIIHTHIGVLTFRFVKFR